MKQQPVCPLRPNQRSYLFRKIVPKMPELRFTVCVQPKRWRTLRHVATAMLLALLASCASTLQPTSPQAQQDKIFEEDPLQPSDNRSVAELLAKLPDTTLSANSALDAETTLLLLPAAVYEKRWSLADKIIQQSNTTAYSIDEYATFSIWVLAYYNQSSQYTLAEQWLNHYALQSRIPLMAVDDQVAIGLARARMLFGLNRFASSAQERIFVEDLIEDTALSDQNQQAIWQTLLKLPLHELQQQNINSKSRSYKSWLELAIIYRDNQLSQTQQIEATRAWQRRWSKKRYVKVLPESILAFNNTRVENYRHIGVFLPFTGKLAAAGNALKDGIAFAYFNQLQNSAYIPRLSFYDTSQQSMESLYTQAINDDVELIIGPLQKQKVAELFTLHTSLPIISLNFLNDELLPPDNIIQFGLAVEDEAVQLAALAKATQHRTVLLLHLDKGWTQRAAQAFAQQWNSYSDVSLEKKMLSLKENYSREIAASLHLAQSGARHQNIVRLLGKKLEFKPRRRQDIDLIVIFADPQQAKAIKPLLAYHYAADITVFSNSNVFTSGRRKSDNKDINGIIFNEMPWLLGDFLRAADANNRYADNKSLNRLFAMGIDAFNIYPRIDYLQQSPDNELSGSTGRLSLNNNRVVRKLSLAKVRRGKAVAITAEQVPSPH